MIEFWAITSITTEEIIKLATVFALSTVKFFIMLFSSRTLLDLSFWQAFFTISAGGLFGVISFYYLSGLIIAAFSRITIFKRKKKHNKSKKIFTRRNKFIVKLKTKYGLYGLALLTPALLSIPVGVFIIRKYYGRNRFALPITCLAIVVWSIAVLLILYLF
jgi:hypothetical protein